MQVNTISGAYPNTVDTQKDSEKASQTSKVKITCDRDTFELTTDNGGKAYFETYSLLEEYKKSKVMDMQYQYIKKNR